MRSRRTSRLTCASRAVLALREASEAYLIHVVGDCSQTVTPTCRRHPRQEGVTMPLMPKDIQLARCIHAWRTYTKRSFSRPPLFPPQKNTLLMLYLESGFGSWSCSYDVVRNCTRAI